MIGTLSPIHLDNWPAQPIFDPVGVVDKIPMFFSLLAGQCPLVVRGESVRREPDGMRSYCELAMHRRIARNRAGGLNGNTAERVARPI